MGIEDHRTGEIEGGSDCYLWGPGQGGYLVPVCKGDHGHGRGDD